MRRLLALALALLAACGGGQSTPVKATGEHWQGSLTPAPSPDALVVAEVGDSKIYDVDVARYAREHGLDARAAVDELIQLELLAQEAARRGLADDPEVAELRKRERVRALLRVAFDAGFKSPDDVPQAEVDRAWADPGVQRMFNHYEYREVRYVRVPVKKGADLATVTAAESRARALRAAVVARAPTSVDEFRSVASEEARLLGIKVEIPAKNYTTSLLHGPGDHEFAQICWTVEQPGQISEPGPTKWGWDTIYLVTIRPETHSTKEEATPEIRKKLFESSRSGAFLQFSDKLMKSWHAWRDESLLDRIEVSAPTGLQ